jgi:hydroxyethylthiazole kinase-like uncharacterized protein yjeF
MRLVISPEESGRLDAAAEDPVDVLMERAGLGVALAAVDLGAGYGSRVTVLAGAGNNGGDGYVAARYLARRGAAVTVQALGRPRREGTAAYSAAERAAAAGVAIVDLGSPEDADLIIDALFGVGFRGALPDAVLPWLDHPAPVVSVDVPSGLYAATGEVSGGAFTADTTVTFHALKPGHLLGEGPERCGAVRIVDIGLRGGDPEFRLCEAADAPLPTRPRTAHKWSVGSVVVVGGSQGMTGAGVLAARSALHGGAGSSVVVCPGRMQPVAAGMTAGVMTRGIGGGDRFSKVDVADVLAFAERFDVMVLGPGLGADDGFAAELAVRRTGKMLIDADGLNNLGGIGPLQARPGATVITPHAGEFRRLSGEQASPGAAASLYAATDAVVLLKGNPTFVVGSERWVVTSGGPELATIGTGDVLSGFVAALWAGGLDAEVAARAAAFWHGVAGADLSRCRVVTAEGLVEAIGEFA